MAEIAVSVDKQGNLRLIPVFRRCNGLAFGAELEALEKYLPARVHRCRIFLPARVRRFDSIQVPASREARADHEPDLDFQTADRSQPRFSNQSSFKSNSWAGTSAGVRFARDRNRKVTIRRWVMIGG